MSEDDFELESKREAKEYAERQSVDHKREQIKEENRRRKERGEGTVRLPRRIKEKKKIAGYYSDEVDDDEEEGSKKRKRGEEDEVELTYEGREYWSDLADLRAYPQFQPVIRPCGYT